MKRSLAVLALLVVTTSAFGLNAKAQRPAELIYDQLDSNGSWIESRISHSNRTKEITEPLWQGTLSFSTSWDGRWVAYAVFGEGIFVLDRRTGISEQWTNGSTDSSPTFAPGNGCVIGWMAFVRNHQIMLTWNPMGGAPAEPQYLYYDPADEQGSPSWSPDGSFIAYTTFREVGGGMHDCTVSAKEVWSDDTPTIVAKTAWAPFGFVRVSPDGTRVMYALDSGSSDDVILFAKRIGTDPTELGDQLESAENLNTACWLPSGGYAYSYWWYAGNIQRSTVVVRQGRRTWSFDTASRIGSLWAAPLGRR